MRSKLLLKQKLTDVNGDLKEMVVWSVPSDPKHPEGVRYRMAFVVMGTDEPAVLYDNHHPKGHHKHILGEEHSYQFLNIDQLIEDFEKDIFKVRRKER